MLGEVVVHGEDIFRSLGPYRDHPVEHVVAVADFYKGSNLLTGTKKRISGLTLRATDADWSHGHGPEATGPMIALVLAMSGRRLPLDDLKGDGVATMRQRGSTGCRAPPGWGRLTGRRHRGSRRRPGAAGVGRGRPCHHGDGRGSVTPPEGPAAMTGLP